MKKIKLMIAGVFIVSLSFGVFAQGDPPDPPGHGESDDQQPGGNAPVSGGVLMLLTMGAAYGGKKVYDMRKMEKIK